MRGDRPRPLSRAAREQPTDLRRELVLELDVLASAPLCFPLTPARTHLLVSQALGLGLLERVLLNEHSLALVTLARAAEAHDHRRQPAVLACATGERRIA
jgi:hypothetical protein